MGRLGVARANTAVGVNPETLLLLLLLQSQQLTVCVPGILPWLGNGGIPDHLMVESSRFEKAGASSLLAVQVLAHLAKKQHRLMLSWRVSQLIS
jgi:hypothetical protein